MSSERDPKTNPLPGDVFYGDLVKRRFHGSSSITQNGKTETWVQFEEQWHIDEPFGNQSKLDSCRMSIWLSWAAKVESVDRVDG